MIKLTFCVEKAIANLQNFAQCAWHSKGSKGRMVGLSTIHY